MQNFRDYYAILGVAKASTAEEIKRAYRGLARQYHPDVNPGDKAAEEKFKLLGEAYGVLSDADKRKQYEQYSDYWSQKGKKNWTKWGRGNTKEADYSAFEDFDNFVEQLLKRHKTDNKSVSRRAAGSVDRGAEGRSSERSSARQRSNTRRRLPPQGHPPNHRRRREPRQRPSYKRQTYAVVSSGCGSGPDCSAGKSVCGWA